MRCQRCRGLIVMECCADTEFSEGSVGVSAMRCLNCGARQYVRVLGHRAASRSQTVERSPEA
jgi:hypothetical protein